MSYAILIFSMSIFASCASIEVYQIGRQTIMEEEAQGDWPEFEKIYAPKKISQNVQFFPNEQNSKRKKRVLNILNGEFINKK